MISVVIPCYNGAEWLGEAIDSAMSQTCHCQIIVVNDGSTDNSLEVAKKYPVLIVNQVNKGLASARNTGIMNSEGEYILFLDADDKLLPNAIERILEEIKITSADVIAPSFREFGLGNRDVVLIDNPNLEHFKIGNRLGYCAAIRRTALLEIGGYNPKMVFGWEDFDLWIDLLKRGKILVTISEILWMYRIKEKSMYTDSLKHSDFLIKQMRLNHPEVYDK